MENSCLTKRPNFVSQDWLRCTNGYAFLSPPSAERRDDVMLSSSNLWDRLICVTLQAQSGDFRNIDSLLYVIEHGPDVHIRDCAVRVFAQSAPLSILPRLINVYRHPDPDTRLEAYTATVMSCDLRLVESLAERRAQTRGFERETIMDCISNMLDPDIDNPEFVDSDLDDTAFTRRVRLIADEFRKNLGSMIAIYRGAPINAYTIIDKITSLCADEEAERHGGAIAELFALLESMTGTPYSGCIDGDCAPVMQKISLTLNSLHQTHILKNFEIGHRYFFGHRIP